MKTNPNNYIEKRCFICKKKFKVYSLKKHHQKRLSYRPRTSKTCSKSCSRIYSHLSGDQRKELSENYKEYEKDNSQQIEQV